MSFFSAVFDVILMDNENFQEHIYYLAVMGTNQGNLDIFQFSASSWLVLKLTAVVVLKCCLKE